MERPARAEQQAQVDIGGLGDHALVEQGADLLGERGQGRLPHLLAGQHRGVTAGRGPDQLGGLGVHPLAVGAPRVDAGPAGGHQPAQALGAGEAVRVGGVQDLGDVQGDGGPDQPEQHQR